MIIYPQAFLLSQAATATPLTHARVCYQSWLDGLAATAIEVSGETANGPKDAPLRPETHEYWEPPALPATWKADLGTSRSVDYFGIGGHTIGSSLCTAKWEYSTDNENWTQFSDEKSASNDGALIWLDDAVDCRWVRLTLSGSGAKPKIGHIKVGVALAMQRPIYAPLVPPTLARNTQLYSARSRGGQFLGQSFRRHGINCAVSFRHLTAAWVRSDLDKFIKHARGGSFFFAWRPATWPLETIYAWATGDIHPRNMGKKDYMEVAWEMQGIGHE